MIKLFILVLMILPTFAQDVRHERHLEATEAFKNLNFFYKGRGMAISPDLIKVFEWTSSRGIGSGDLGPLYQRWGLIVQNNNVRGLFSVPYEGMKVGVLGCVACHSGKAAGQYIVGLGNKNIDTGQIGRDAYQMLRVWG